MLWRGHQPQEEAAGKAEGGQEADAGIWFRFNPSGSLYRSATDGRRGLTGRAMAALRLSHSGSLVPGLPPGKARRLGQSAVELVLDRLCGGEGQVLRRGDSTEARGVGPGGDRTCIY